MSERTPIILCGGSAGRAVIFGYVDSLPEQGQPAVLFNARMVLRWEGRAGLFGLAAKGPEPGSRLTESVPRVEDIDWKQHLVCTPEGAAALAAWPAE